MSAPEPTYVNALSIAVIQEALAEKNEWMNEYIGFVWLHSQYRKNFLEQNNVFLKTWW